MTKLSPDIDAVCAMFGRPSNETVNVLPSAEPTNVPATGFAVPATVVIICQVPALLAGYMAAAGVMAAVKSFAGAFVPSHAVSTARTSTT